MKPIVPAKLGITRLETWLRSTGLTFDPFYVLEGSADPNLFAYLVGHAAFEVAWGEWPSFVFAPAGGGKTTLRSRVVQACWATQQTNRPFPIVYHPQFLKWGDVTPSLEEHLSALAEAAGLYLLLILTHRPHWFMRLSKEEKETIRNTLEWNLATSLEAYLIPCREENDLSSLSMRFPPASIPPDPPSRETLGAFFDALLSTAVWPAAKKPRVEICWEAFLKVVRNILQVPAIYILLDGLDSTDSTSNDPFAAVQVIASLLDEAPRWAYEKTYFKAFVPIETRVPLEKEFPNILSQSQVIEIIWTPALLAEVVRRRVYVASRGEFGSLSMLASPGLRDIEFTLAKEVHPLPREMLALTHRVLEESAVRTDTRPVIEASDVGKALEWYRNNTVYLQDRSLIGGKHV